MGIALLWHVTLLVQAQPSCGALHVNDSVPCMHECVIYYCSTLLGLTIVDFRDICGRLCVSGDASQAGEMNLGHSGSIVDQLHNMHNLAAKLFDVINYRLWFHMGH